MNYIPYFKTLALIFHAPSHCYNFLIVLLKPVEPNDSSYPKNTAEVYAAAADMWCVTISR